MQSKHLDTFSYRSGKWKKFPMHVIGEKGVALTVNNEPWLTFMCTPSDLEALAIGFLHNEEIIETMDEVASVRVCSTGDNIDVWLNHSVQKPEKWTRTSGCSGGKTSVGGEQNRVAGTRSKNGMMISVEKVTNLIQLLSGAQDLYRKTGGVHTSALSDGDKIFLTAEDIGRHNTLDKLEGRCLMEGIDLEKKLVLTTGRISSEMIQKANRMGAVMVISRTSPSTLSVEMAARMEITLIGYARHDRFTIYTHPERILSSNIGEKIRMR